MAARISLKDQLAELSQPAPIDLDPEDALAPNDPSHEDRFSSAIDDPAAREHYIDVAPSALRKLHDSVSDPKYDGVRTSRKHLYDEDSHHASQDEDMTDDQEQGDSDLDDLSHSDDATDEDEELASPAEDADSQDESQSGSGSEHEHPQSSPPSRQDRVNEASTSLSKMDISSGQAPQPENDIASNLRKTHEADKKKGKAVSRQIALWDTLLDARIQLHKAVTAANRLPFPAEVVQYASHPAAREALDSLVSVADSLTEELFSLQENLLRTNESIEPPARKRRRVSPPPSPSPSAESPSSSTPLSSYSDTFVAHSASASALEASYHPWALDTLSKWSAKVQAVAPNVLLPDAKGSFLRGGKDPKTLGVVALVDDILRADRAKLLDRTRKRKDKHARLGHAAPPSTAEGAGGRKEEEEEETLDADVFDDTDYYQQLLRDVIAARAGAQDAAGEEQWRIQQRERKAKRKKTVDTKASKGRKLRFEVHPKLQNFMVPVPVVVGEWHEEQIDGLFSSLLQP
ncbi:TRAUB-domain-containing protein [Trametes coccinea BRFM310]|uniref:Protein BFR2 n=1 Tax=Trametes coccinea (strain BRFM310) TaxID=1353009 RepID=A0A1Y2ISU4_TRAC3|nr:TRAUB-domain-containing protein [Trametes coccinea BRFM310]